MKTLKKIFSTFLILSVLSANITLFSLPVLAYQKDGANFERARSEALTDNSVDFFDKINSISKEANRSSPDSSITKRVATELEKSQPLEGEGQGYVEGEVLVKYRSNRINLNTSSGRATALNFIRSKSLEQKEDLQKINTSVLRIKDTKTVEQKVAELKNDPNVEYVQPNYQYYPSVIATNDPDRALLWGLDNTGQNVNSVIGSDDADIDAPEAWSISEGSNGIIVAVIDSGVAYNHPDLMANMWDGSGCK